ncbi:MAG: hypothetical protein V3S68_06995 [Dehalococcoidia bacterium]
MFYEVLVGNIGKVWDSNSHDGGGDYEAANGIYHSYIILSKGDQGRATGQAVTLWRDAEIIEEYEPRHADETIVETQRRLRDEERGV